MQFSIDVRIPNEKVILTKRQIEENLINTLRGSSREHDELLKQENERLQPRDLAPEVPSIELPKMFAIDHTNDMKFIEGGSNKEKVRN